MKIYLVGGAVRDQLLNYPYHEKDWVVVGATPEQLLEQGYRPVGKDFPVFLHPKSHEEYALARTERKTAPGYKGFIFHTDTSVTLEEDLERRDLTINAIAKDSNGNLSDPYNGQQDIAEKKLRHVSIAFREDPVRILRIARFLARFHHLGFSVAEETIELAKTMVAAGETKHLVAERVWQETTKALQEADPHNYFIFLQTCDALADVFPELTKNLTADRTTELLPKAIANLIQVTSKTTHPIERFAAFCRVLNDKEITSLCKRLGTPNEFSEFAILAKKHSAAILSSSPHCKNDVLTTEALIVQIDKILKETSAIRKPKRFKQLIKLVIWLDVEDEEGLVYSFWLALLAEYEKVDPQKWITQGYNGAQLGDKIQEDRIGRIREHINNHSSFIKQ